jgi:hypothetical protein
MSKKKIPLLVGSIEANAAYRDKHNLPAWENGHYARHAYTADEPVHFTVSTENHVVIQLDGSERLAELIEKWRQRGGEVIDARS